MDTPPPPGQGEKTTYTITVKTSDVLFAGTDANVYVVLTGDKGSGPQVQLKTSLNHRNKFERNHSDVFVFDDQKPLGTLKTCKIWHDNTGIGPGWHLQVVEVNDGMTGISYVFPCNQWFDKREGDKQLCRVLQCPNAAIAALPPPRAAATEMSRILDNLYIGRELDSQNAMQMSMNKESCKAGVSRSVTLAAAYLMSVTDYSFAEVLRMIKKYRSVACPNDGFMRQLEAFEKGDLENERRRIREKFGLKESDDTLGDNSELQKRLAALKAKGLG